MLTAILVLFDFVQLATMYNGGVRIDSGRYVKVSPLLSPYALFLSTILATSDDNT